MASDEVWSAIGDPTRRRLLDLLLEHGTATASTLSGDVSVTRQAVAKHLAVLERVDLVRSTTHGRERVYEPDHAQLALAAAQLAAVGASWDGRLRRIAGIAERVERTKRKATDQAKHRNTQPEDTP